MRIRLLALLFLVLACIHPVVGQSLGLGNRKDSSSPPPSTSDPLGRTTPRGTITAFIRSVHRDDYVSAARYMQVGPKQRANVEVLARDLKELMDRYFGQALTSISDVPSGSLDDGLPLDRERVGPLAMRNGSSEIILVRVNDLDVGPIWLISSETLSQVPSLYDEIEQSWIERVTPAPLLQYSLFGMSMALWVGWVTSIAIPGFALLMLAKFDIFLIRRFVVGPLRRQVLESWFQRLQWPTIILLSLICHVIAVSFLGFSLTFRIIERRIALVVLVFVAAWLTQRIATLAFDRVRGAMQRRRRTNTESLVLLGERFFKALIACAAILAVLSIIGVDTKTALAGLGIGGVAVALGAQKTVENLLGGIFLLSDKTLAVGDMCSISNRQGWIEDITLRSVRLRTLEQTLLSIPAGILSQANIENFATRGKILAQTILQLRYGTSVEQLRSVLNGISKLLAENTKIEPDSARIRLVNFGQRAIELELYVYILTPDNMEFLQLREDLLLQIASLVEAAGSGFAQPTQFIYVEEDSAPNGSTAGAARSGADLLRN